MFLLGLHREASWRNRFMQHFGEGVFLFDA